MPNDIDDEHKFQTTLDTHWFSRLWSYPCWVPTLVCWVKFSTSLLVHLRHSVPRGPPSYRASVHPNLQTLVYRIFGKNLRSALHCSATVTLANLDNTNPKMITGPRRIIYRNFWHHAQNGIVSVSDKIGISNFRVVHTNRNEHHHCLECS